MYFATPAPKVKDGDYARISVGNKLMVRIRKTKDNKFNLLDNTGKIVAGGLSEVEFEVVAAKMRKRLRINEGDIILD